MSFIHFCENFSPSHMSHTTYLTILECGCYVFCVFVGYSWGLLWISVDFCWFPAFYDDFHVFDKNLPQKWNTPRGIATPLENCLFLCPRASRGRKRMRNVRVYFICSIKKKVMVLKSTHFVNNLIGYFKVFFSIFLNTLGVSWSSYTHFSSHALYCTHNDHTSICLFVSNFI